MRTFTLIYYKLLKNALNIYRLNKDPFISFAITIMLVRLVIDYGQVTFYKPYYMFLIALIYTYINSIYKTG